MRIHGGDIYRNPGVLDFSANCNCFGMPESVQAAAMRGVQRSEEHTSELQIGRASCRERV